MNMEEKEVSRTEKISVNVAVILSLITGFAFTMFNWFILILISHDYPTAMGFVVEGNRVPADIFNIWVIMAIISFGLGIRYGFMLWEAFFIRLGLIPRESDA